MDYPVIPKKYLLHWYYTRPQQKCQGGLKNEYDRNYKRRKKDFI